MSDFTPEQVERAAEVLWFGPGRSTFYGLDELSESSRSTYRAFAEEVLSAAGAPERVAPVRIDPSELAAKIYSLEYQVDPDSAEPGDIEDRLGMADELIEWFAEKHIPTVDEAALEALRSVRDLHAETPYDTEQGTICSECTRINRYGVTWYPCPTMRRCGVRANEHPEAA